MLYCPNFFVVQDQKDWDSTALLLVFLPKFCTVRTFANALLFSWFGSKKIGTVQHFWFSCKNAVLSFSTKMSENAALSQSSVLLVTRRPRRSKRFGFLFFGTVQHFCYLGFVFWHSAAFLQVRTSFHDHPGWIVRGEHTCMYIYIYMFLCICGSTYIYICIYVHVCMRVHTKCGLHF